MHWQGLLKCNAEADTVRATQLQKRHAILLGILGDLGDKGRWEARVQSLGEFKKEAETYLSNESPWKNPELFSQMQAQYDEIDYVLGGRLFTDMKDRSKNVMEDKEGEELT